MAASRSFDSLITYLQRLDPLFMHVATALARDVPIPERNTIGGHYERFAASGGLFVLHRLYPFFDFMRTRDIRVDVDLEHGLSVIVASMKLVANRCEMALANERKQVTVAREHHWAA